MLAAPSIWLLAASVIEAAPGPCPAPADLPPGGDAAYVAPASGGADLAPPAYRLPEKIPIPLRLYLPPPVPFGSEAELGAATVDLATGALAFGDPLRPGGAGAPRAAPPAQAPWAAPGAPLAPANGGGSPGGAASRPSDCR